MDSHTILKLAGGMLLAALAAPSGAQDAPFPKKGNVEMTVLFPAGTSADVDRALRALPPNQQEVIRLKFQHGLKYKEIAAVTGLSVSNVGFLIHTAIKQMRGTLGGPQ